MAFNYLQRCDESQNATFRHKITDEYKPYCFLIAVTVDMSNISSNANNMLLKIIFIWSFDIAVLFYSYPVINCGCMFFELF